MLTEEGFEVFDATFDNGTGKFRTTGKQHQPELIDDGNLVFNDFLRINYNNEPAEPSFLRNSSLSISVPIDAEVNNVVRGAMATRKYPESDLQVSYLFNRASKLVLNEKGQIKDATYLLTYGYWNWEKVPNQLPQEYHLAYIGRK